MRGQRSTLCTSNRFVKPLSVLSIILRNLHLLTLSSNCRDSVYKNKTKGAAAECPYSTCSHRLHSHGNHFVSICMWMFLYRIQCRFVHEHLWRFICVLTPGLASSIDQYRVSLILVPAWPETIGQGVELSSGFNDLPAPSLIPHTRFWYALFFWVLTKRGEVHYHTHREKWNRATCLFPLPTQTFKLLQKHVSCL